MSGSQPVRLYNSAGEPVLFDPHNLGLITTDALDNRTHLGEVYTIGAVSGSIAKDSSYIVYLKTPSTHELHTRLRVSGTDAYSYTVHEGVTVSSEGTPLSCVNMNRNSICASTALAYHTPSISGAGTIISAGYQGSADIGGGGDTNISEVILKHDCGYTLTMTAKKQATYFTIKLLYWEHVL